ncbi:MAG: hypothetical protein RBS81_12360 [Tenuifilaceae bacterium]|jgi:hypothetical protein|nr:hypothetical protein [Tenuifilaceae bacterium]
MGIGGYILGFVGACVRWLYGTTWRTIANRPKYKFSEYLNGPEYSDDWFDMTGHDFVNRVVGMITIVMICWIAINLGI